MRVLKYEIFLDFDVEKESFKGIVKIFLDKPNRNLKLDKEDLKILKVLCEGKKVDFEDRKNFLLVKNAGKEIEIEYEGKVSKSLSGLYKANYNSKFMFSTQFEAIGARKVFPCLDHPSYKARFKISVSVRKPFEVISNESLEKIEDLGEKRVFVFKETCEMPTYLVYIGIGEFEKIEDRNKILIRAIVPKGKEIRKAKYSLLLTRKFFDFMQDYFVVEYPLSKLDIIAVPEFAAGAMENFGAITFREFFVLTDKSTSLKQKRRIKEVIAHELIHQWFGNLVTMKNWDDLWLNESFATYLSFFVLDKVFPKDKIFREFLLSNYFSSLSSDSLINTHSIKVKVSKIEEIDQIFDDISYGKGACILRMFANYLGEGSFRKVLIEYLNRHKFSNASFEDFLKVLETYNLSEAFRDWILKKGHPLIKASLKKGKVFVKQEVFKFLNSKEKTVWKIPVFLKTDKKESVYLLEKEKGFLNEEKFDFIFLNSKANGYYRVLYDGKLLKMILRNKKKLNEEEKAVLINDYFSFLLAGRISLNYFLRILKEFIKDEDFLVISTINSIFSFFNEFLPKNKKIQKLTLTFLKYHYPRIEAKKDYLLLGKLATLYAKISPDFNKKIIKKEYPDVHPDLRLAYAISLVKEKGKEGFENLLEIFERASDEDRIKIFTSLFFAKEESLRALAYSLILTKCKKQEWPILLVNSFSNHDNVEIGWLWLKENLKNIMETFKGSYQPRRIMESIIPIIGLYKEKELKEFLKKNKFEYAKIGIINGFEWLEIYKKFLRKYS
ncbi:MAG: M1 family metallopeptidase [Candidatus Aenigmatarchaeota archaeon]